MIELALAGLIASAGLSPPAGPPERAVQEVQYRAGPGGECPDGFAYNFSDGYCYRNGRQPPGMYRPPEPQYGGGSCPDGYDYNYSNGNCYPNRRHAPGLYNQGVPRSGACPDGFDYNYSNGRCYLNGGHAPGVYAR
jgi:hypothetical protein